MGSLKGEKLEYPLRTEHPAEVSAKPNTRQPSEHCARTSDLTGFTPHPERPSAPTDAEHGHPLKTHGVSDSVAIRGDGGAEPFNQVLTPV